MLSNQAEIERLQQQIARLRNQIPEIEHQIRVHKQKTESADEALCMTQRNRQGFEFSINRKMNVAWRLQESTLKSARAVAIEMTDKYVGSCQRRYITEEAFAQIEKFFVRKKDESEATVSTKRKELDRIDQQILQIQRQINRLRAGT